jgi:tight adherence protein B
VILLAIFASIFVVSQLLLGAAWESRARNSAVNKRLRMIREGIGREEIVARLRKSSPSDFAHLPPLVRKALNGMQRNIFAAALPFTLNQLLGGMAFLLVLTFVALLFLAVLGGYAIGPGVALLLFALSSCVAIAIPLTVINMIAQRRRKRIEEQFPVALDVFVRALRSGHPIAASIDLLTQEMEDPIGSEFGLVADEVTYGAELADALEAMADRWDLEDMRMFVISLSVQSETGGNLAEILVNLSEVIRARASMYLKVRALSSEGRMTGWMLTVLPIFALVSMFMVNPGFYLDVAGDPIFLIGFPGLIALYFVGLFTIRRMVDLKV